MAVATIEDDLDLTFESGSALEGVVAVVAPDGKRVGGAGVEKGNFIDEAGHRDVSGAACDQVVGVAAAVDGDRVAVSPAVDVYGLDFCDGQVIESDRISAAAAVDVELLGSSNVEREGDEVGPLEADACSISAGRESIPAGAAAVDDDHVGA